MLLVEFVRAFVLTAVLPHVVAEAMHHAVLEAALEVAAIGPLESAVATHFVVLPHSTVARSICPEVSAFEVFHSISEMSVVVAAIAPHLNAFAVLLILHSGFRHLFQRVQILLDVVPMVLTEDGQVCQSVLLPKAFVDFVAGLRGTENSHAARLAVNPVAFEGAAIRPDQSSVATLGVLVANDRVFLLLGRGPLLCALACFLAARFLFAFFAVDGQKSHLSHEFH